jgi:hypothetical protein
MRTVDVNVGRDFISDRNLIGSFAGAVRDTGDGIDSSLIGIPAEEEYKDFFEYLKLIGMPKDKDLLMLQPVHHYYYEAEELKNIRSVVNLKLLNHIKQLMEFLYTIFHILPAGSYFIGCFFDNKKQNGFNPGSAENKLQLPGWAYIAEAGKASRSPFLNMIYNMLDFRNKRYLTKRSVTILLEESYLKVLDMTELNGLTYFCSQKVQNQNI